MTDELPTIDFVRGYLHAVPVHDSDGCACHGLAAYMPALVAEMVRLRANENLAKRVVLAKRAGLTAVEDEIVHQLVSTTLSLEAIAGARFTSINTVKTHVKNVYRKFGVATRRELRTLVDGIAA